MLSMSELRAYKEALKALHVRHSYLKEQSEIAHKEWVSTEGAPGTFNTWNDRIKEQVECEAALYNLNSIVARIEGNVSVPESKWLGVGHDPSGEQY